MVIGTNLGWLLAFTIGCTGPANIAVNARLIETGHEIVCSLLNAQALDYDGLPSITIPSLALTTLLSLL